MTILDLLTFRLSHQINISRYVLLYQTIPTFKKLLRIGNKLISFLSCPSSQVTAINNILHTYNFGLITNNEIVTGRG